MRRPLATLFDAAAPDLAKGVRAAVVMLAPFYLASALARPELGWMALGGWLGTLGDPGGSRATRAKALITFTIAGAGFVALMEALSPSTLLATLVLTATAFAMSLLRAAGGTAGSIGTLLTMIAAIAGARTWSTPGRDALSFGLGALLAMVLSSAVWPVWTHLPVRRAVARVYRELAAYAEEVQAVIATQARQGDPRWNTLVRQHHLRVRTAIEEAGAVALAARARREGETRYGGNVRALLGVADGQFPVLASLVYELEALPPGARAEAARRLLPIAANDREVERVLVARAIRSRARASVRRPRRSLPPVDTSSTAESLAARLETATGDAVDLAHRIDEEPSAPASNAHRSGDRASTGAPGAEPTGGLAALRNDARLVRDALSPRSVFFQHAVRVASAGLVASIVGDALSPKHTYWVTLTALAILQPYPGATIKRAGERLVGTILGCLLALAIMTWVTSPLALSALLVPLSVAAVATRPRSYRLFTFFLTPVFVLLADRNAGDWWTAAARAGDAMLGGLVALVAGVLVFPSSERERLPDTLAAMIDAVAAYAEVVLGAVDDRRAPGAEARIAGARRAAGVAFAAAETSLERFLAEPLRPGAHAAETMLLVTYTRRLGTSLTAVDTLAATALDAQERRDGTCAAVTRYTAAVLARAKAYVRGESVAPAPAPPEVDADGDGATPIDAAIARVVRWAELRRER